jgi:RecB family exonuclease
VTQDLGGQQLGFEGMPRRLYACTPTRLSTWLDCLRRYRMTYLDRPPPGKGPPWAHNSLGASVHNTLAGWWRLPRGRRTVAAAGDLLDQGWLTEGYADPQQSARYRHWARRMVEAYVTGLDPASEPVGVERTVATRTDLIALSGRIDRLDDRRGPGGSGELVVVDYKTGRHVLSVDDARTSLPLALYALAAERVMRRPCRRVELHHLPTGRVLAWEHTPESLARQLRRAEAIAEECATADERFRAGSGGGSAAAEDPAGHPAAPLDEVFAPRPGTWCGWCDYRAHCPEGSAASEPRRQWDGLGATEPDPADAGAALASAAQASPAQPEAGADAAARVG